LREAFDLGRLTRMVRPAGRSRSSEVAGVLLMAEGGQFLPILALTLIVGIVTGDATNLLTPRASLGFVGILATAIASLAAGWRILRGSRPALWAGVGLAALYTGATVVLLASHPWTTEPGDAGGYLLLAGPMLLGLNGFILVHATLALTHSSRTPPRPDAARL
jgi:hypothetical protein